MYSIEITSTAAKAIKRLSKPDRDRVMEAIESLNADPRPIGCKKMKGRAADAYRIRIGGMRVVYEVRDKVLVVVVINVGHRGGVYKR
jgi:mRNA interferase RelE/StbE